MTGAIKHPLPFKDIPEGTVTFLFTDIEGSTQILKQLGSDKYGQVLADQRRILREAFAKWDGQEVDTQGDAFFVAFPRATQAVSAAVEIQRELAAHQWPGDVEVRVRMGLHTGEPLKAEEGYVGMDVHRAARIAHVGHGGQVLLSETTAPLVVDELPEGVELLDLGRHRLKDMRRPERIRQLVIEGLPPEFPPLKSLEMLPPTIALEAGEVKLPDFLKEDVERAPPSVFVGRERELAQLQGYIKQAQSGQGGVVFITGGPGRGKTALMQAFARRSMESYPDLLIASGKCNAYTGVGDPYLPFREVLGDLTGDVEIKWVAGAISTDHAKRLWEVTPETAQALVNHSPDLMGVFISGQSLMERISSAVPGQRRLLQSLRSMTERERATPGELEQKAIFKQYLNTLCELSAKYPLLILLDDLQWADTASLNLLFHLGRELSGGRILLMGAYRLEEVALGRGGERHPLEDILAEFKRLYGEVWIDLSQTPKQESQRFVDDFIDSEPNRFSDEFRGALFTHTGGHPLFTIELLREMHARGDLVQDEDGYWVEGETLNWDLLPPRVEGVIEARIGRLEKELREILTIASVEGEDFTAQVIARVKEASERELVHQLSGELDKVHRLVKEQGARKVADHRLFLYRFQHQLFQKFLYNGLGEYERELLHAEVGEVLEELYGEQCEDVAAQLAWHFSEAGEVDKAIHYSLLAGDRARSIYAYQEAIDYYQLAIGYLKDQGNNDLAARTLMKLGLTYHTIFDYRRSRLAYDEAFTLRQRMGTAKSPVLQPAPHSLRLQFEEPSTLDPTKSRDNVSNFFITNIFSGLIELSSEYDIVPDVAQSWEISEDGCRYCFYLRDGITWSDGEPVTAADFEYACKRILDPANDDPLGIAISLYDIKSARAYQLGEISDPDQVGVRAIDALTLEVELERPANYFLHLLTILYPIPQHVVEFYGEVWAEPDNLVSNGPFLLKSYLPGESITLTRNPTYHGRFIGNLQTVEVRFGMEQNYSDALERYRSNSIDLVRLEYTTYDARRQYIGEYVSVPWPATFYIGFDTSRPPFDDSRIRQAFVMAIDREKLVEEVLGGFLNPGSGGFVPPGFPGYSPGIGLPFNPEKARQLLTEAGYPDGKGLPTLELLTNDNPLREKSALALKEVWGQELGIQVSVTVMGWTEFLKNWRRSQLFLSAWDADYPDPDSFMRVGVRRVASAWQHADYDRLIDRAARITDQTERLILYQQADQILMEEAAIVPLSYSISHHLIKPWVRNIDIPYPIMKDVIIEPH